MRTIGVPLDWVNVVFIPLVHALALFGFLTFNWKALTLGIALWWITGSVGIGLGFHRYLSHRGFACHQWFAHILAVFGTLAGQGGPLSWVGGHRRHHAYSDGEFDPHNSRKGFWWSHIGWLFYRDGETSLFKSSQKYAEDLSSDPVMVFLQKWALGLQVVLGLLLVAWGGWSFVIWGIFVRLVFGWHCTWLVNSAAHIFGYQTFESGDESRNCWWVALLTFGEGWHNNHHAFPRSARHGMRWWEFDQNYLLIRTLQILGLVWDVRVADRRMTVRRRMAHAMT
jgi:fatty-acid desaturase